MLSMVVVAAAGAGTANAQGGIPACSSLANPIYMKGTTAVVPLVRRLGAKLAQLPTPHTLIWQNRAACEAITYITSPPTTSVVINQTASYFVEASNGKIAELSCNLTNTQTFDIAISDIFASSCPQSYQDHLDLIPAGYKEFLGPVQGLVPIVAQSYLYYTEITAEELSDIYMCGTKGRILTFTDDRFVANYADLDGMRELMALAMGVRGSVFHIFGSQGSAFSTFSISGQPTATEVMTAIASTINVDASIAYTSTEVYDDNRDQVRALKLRGLNQKRAYLPDTDLTSRDKINIREGRYTVQSALKLVAHVDANLVPDRPGAKKLVDWLLGNPVLDPALQLPVDIVSIYAQSGVVPQCAMKVTKDTDNPIFRPFAPEHPCHCFFQTQATGAQSIAGCTPCTTSATCAAGQSCSYGYCE
jgi:ABC-type phosphate transport system substrate-binding protein